MRRGKYVVTFEVDWKLKDDGKRDMDNLFIEGCLSDLEITHGLRCNKIVVKDKCQVDGNSVNGEKHG